MNQEQPGYLSYLLRLWQTQSGSELVWRASLENARNGERHSFANLDALCRFLRQQMHETCISETEKGGTMQL